MKTFLSFFLSLGLLSATGCVVVESDFPDEDTDSVVVEEVVDGDAMEDDLDVPVVSDTPAEGDAMEAVEDVVIVEPSFKDRIEDGRSFVVLEDGDMDKDHIIEYTASCEGLESFSAQIASGEVARLVLFEAGQPFPMSLRVIATPNYEAWTTAEFRAKITPCTDGVGYRGPLKAYEDHLLWGSPSCSGGVVPDEGEEAEYLKCLEVEKQLKDYLDPSGNFFG